MRSLVLKNDVTLKIFKPQKGNKSTFLPQPEMIMLRTVREKV